jgi:hypothetical protein
MSKTYTIRVTNAGAFDRWGPTFSGHDETALQSDALDYAKAEANYGRPGQLFEVGHLDYDRAAVEGSVLMVPFVAVAEVAVV